MRLRVRFIERTALDIQILYQQLEIARSDAQALTRMAHIAHAIRGAGATLGFRSIGECAARLEALIKQRLSTLPAPPAPSVLGEIGTLIAGLDQRLQAAQTDPPPQA